VSYRILSFATGAQSKKREGDQTCINYSFSLSTLRDVLHWITFSIVSYMPKDFVAATGRRNAIFAAHLYE
jgi:hypothetical protein